VTVGLLVVLLVAALVATIVAISFVRRSFPQTDGTITVPGLSAEVTVLRDAQGVPQIYADTVADLARAQGYVHAQDRFFEMDLRRHVTAGRLAELVGPAGVAADKVIRTMGWRRVAEAELPSLRPETRQYLRAYADGVNAYLKGRPQSKVSLEYVVLGMRVPDYQIEEWTPADSVAWLKAMAWDLRGNYSAELARARLAGKISDAQLAALYPPYPMDEHAPILSSVDWSPAKATGARSASPPAFITSATAAAVRTRTPDPYAAAQAALDAVPQLVGRGEGIGSNSWVVSGAHTTTGKPLLANDPHLAPGIPGIWYQVGLHCRTVSATCPIDVSGFSFSGVPGVVIGHNAKIAWGFTNLGPDVSDFFLEKVDGQGRYFRGGVWHDLETRTETIKVAGQPDEQLTIRSTVHGPLLSDVSTTVQAAGQGPARGEIARTPETVPPYALSLSWTGLIPNRTADAIFALNSAQDFTQFRAAAQAFAVPAQNLVYADTEGNIGYQAPGLIPKRIAGPDGSPPGYWPRPGWDPAYDWQGFVPFRELPWTLAPKEGQIVAANQAVTASQTPFLTTEWDYGYRSQRIRELLSSRPKVSPDDMRAIQLDNRDTFAPTLVKALLEVPLRGDAFTREAQDLLRNWDFTTPADSSTDSAAAAYFNAVWSALLRILFDDELPADLYADGGSRSRAAVTALLEEPRSAWWDDTKTLNITEGKVEILRQALVEARLDLTRSLGKEPKEWSWGRLHQLELKSQVLGGDAVPAPVRWVFNRGGYALPGGSSIVNANGWDAAKGFAVNWAPSMRMVVDLGNFDDSTWINQTGASGHAFHEHYADQVEDWAAGRQNPWPFSEAAVRRAAQTTLRLVPAASG
jgi:penicillin amidase